MAATKSIAAELMTTISAQPVSYLKSLAGPPLKKFDLHPYLLALTCQVELADGTRKENLDYVLFSAMGRAMAGAYLVRKTKPGIHWFQSYILTCMAAFGGGWLSGVLLGDPPGPIANDVVMVVTTVAWWLMNWFPLDLFCAFYGSTPGQIIGKFMDGMLRYRMIFQNIQKTIAIVKPSPLYPNPIIGPLVVGTITGCGGAFLPLDKGVSILADGGNWSVESSILASLAYYFCTVDTYVSPIVLSHVDKDTVRVCVVITLVTVDILVLLTKFNPFSLFWAVWNFLITGGRKQTAKVPESEAKPATQKAKKE